MFLATIFDKPRSLGHRAVRLGLLCLKLEESRGSLFESKGKSNQHTLHIHIHHVASLPRPLFSIRWDSSYMQSANAFIWPCPESYNGGDFISSTFGPRIEVTTHTYDFHRGIDISGSIGDFIVAPYTGVVEKSVTYAAGGRTVILKHQLPGDSAKLLDDSKSTTRFYTLYMYIAEIVVQIGDIVEQGSILGTMGMTGSALSPHLHTEVRLGTRCKS